MQESMSKHLPVGARAADITADITFKTRTQLDTIIGFTEMLAEELTDHPSARADLDRIRSSAQAVETLITELEDHANRARREAERDPLTGIANRRAFELHCERLFATETEDPTSLVLIDVDRFKHVNDTYGHLAGDEVLREVVQRSKSAVRDSDILARLAGDEFVLLLPATPIEEALRVADRVRHAIVFTPVSIDTDVHVPVTVSVGVATRHEGDEEVSDLLERADRAMYRSKNDGRNRITSLVD
ncbi:MAG: diguanylate cyclase [Myxococcales bacterium]|nr:diguanylate cyclase [Myxococcales bacterium]